MRLSHTEKDVSLGKNMSIWVNVGKCAQSAHVEQRNGGKLKAGLVALPRWGGSWTGVRVRMGKAEPPQGERPPSWVGTLLLWTQG